MGRGKLIVVEGLDNGGKSTFVEYFVKLNPLVIPKKFPSKSVGEIMNQIKYADINWKIFHDLFHTDIQNQMKQIDELLEQGFTVICDRYCYSHWVYEELRSDKRADCMFYNSNIPDVIIYLRPDNLEVLDKNKDNLESGIDYVRGQELFDEMFDSVNIEVITVPALKPDTNDKIMEKLSELFGSFI